MKRRWLFVVAAAVPCLVFLYLFIVGTREAWLISHHRIIVIPTPKHGDTSAPEMPASSLLPWILVSGALAATFAYAGWRSSRRALAAGYLAIVLIVGQAVVRHML